MSLPVNTPYYQDDQVTLFHGDCLEVVGQLPAESVNLLLTDPPYFRVKAEDWDRQWKSTSLFLDWMGSWMDATKPALTPNASLYVFASPELTSQVEKLIRDRWSVLNVIRWVKEQGWHNKARAEDLRAYLSPWEGVIFAEQFTDAYGEESRGLHKEVFAPLGRYIQSERERSGWGRSELEVALGYVSRSDPTKGTALVYRWEEGSSLPTKDAYDAMRSVLNRYGGDYLRREYEDLRREYEDLRREYEDLRRPFSLTKQHPRSDIWNFSTVSPYVGKHPCEKPTSVLEMMVTASSRPGDTVLDLFAGSGSTLLAARNNGRKAIGVEMSERYCELIAKRLDQMCLDFGSAS
ncbi:DNA-methyltransferase [Mycolicibacterium houstonense]|uniref:DNA-methyltransferase n=1 Tax=Mycolicibacterium houstonense TaxID=146021 RepID=UPI000832E88B|nr:site-specific DNA-methyltransferase [Mycolicibacterium houstonense]